MSYRIVFDRPAEKQFRRLPADTRQALARRISSLAANPHPPESKKLEGAEGCYRIRQGDYRIVYTIVERILVVAILRVGRRDTVYSNLSAIAKAAQALKRNK